MPAPFAPELRTIPIASNLRRYRMSLATLSFDQIAMAAMTVLALREVMIATLPDRIAGPNGWLVNTNAGDRV